MDREINWTEPALDDLDEAAAYIARDSEFYAAAFVNQIREAAESIAIFPERGQIVPGQDDPALREILVSPYRIVYYVLEFEIRILAIVHGALRDRR